MYLKITVICPICSGETGWIYDTEVGKLHRGAQGCGGGCTAIQDIYVDEVNESDAKEFVNRNEIPMNSLDL